MVSSNGVAAVDGAGVSDCAASDEKAARLIKMLIHRVFTTPTVLGASESTSGKLMSLQKAMNFLGELGPDPFRRGDLFHGRFAQPVH